MSLMINVQTSSQKRYVSRCPYIDLSVTCLRRGASPNNLKCHTRFDLLREHICNSLVEVGKNLHGELWFDAALGDQRVERVRKGTAEAAFVRHDTYITFLKSSHLLLR